MGYEETSLLVLAEKLRSLSPPSLSVIIAPLVEAEDYQAFLDLVREFLPEEEQAILRQSTPASQMATFADRFQNRYFPLDDCFRGGDIEGYSDLARGIPVIPLGNTPDDYHEIPGYWRLGFQLMTYMLEAPAWAGEGARVVLAESCAEDVSPEILRRVPEGGLSRQDAHRILDGTRYEALGFWADVWEMDTGNYFLDTSGEELWNVGCPPGTGRRLRRSHRSGSKQRGSIKKLALLPTGWRQSRQLALRKSWTS